jgi:proline racemase
MISSNMIASEDNPANLKFEMTAGTINVEVGFASDKVEWCRFEGPPAFVFAQDLPIELPDIGAAVADLVRIGHGCIACVKWPKQIKSIDPMNAGFFSRTGQQVQRIVKEISEPCSDIPDQMGVSFYHEPTNPIALYRNVVIFGDGKVDRAPNGTATCAMMAAEEARGNIQIGQTIYSEGLLGSGMFEGCLVRETNVENNRALIGTVKGKSKITGYAKWAIDREDPVGSGFIVQ